MSEENKVYIVLGSDGFYDTNIVIMSSREKAEKFVKACECHDEKEPQEHGDASMEWENSHPAKHIYHDAYHIHEYTLDKVL